MSLDMFQRLREAFAAEFIMPVNRFFEPNDSFWTILEDFKRVQFVDCGAGAGHVTEEALRRGFNMRAIDVSPREGQLAIVERANALRETWSRDKWPLICRPDHSGWSHEVFVKARSQGALGIYVGKPTNLPNDVGVKARVLRRNVGAEAETMYLVKYDQSVNH